MIIDTYYTEACICGANPALHIGHTQQCADEYIRKIDNNVKTWADGYGRWHAEVPDSRMGLSRAVRSIAMELFDRAPRTATFIQIREYVEQNIISLASDKPGRIHFAEYAID